MLTGFDWAYGIAQLAAGFLAIIAGVLAISMIHQSRKQKKLKAWVWLLIAIALFALVEFIGAARAFELSENPYIVHVLVGLLLGFLIAGLNEQININRGWLH